MNRRAPFPVCFSICVQRAALKTPRPSDARSPSHNVQLNPYALAQNEHTLETLDPMNPFFSSRHLEGTAGGEGKAILKDSIVFDATINPDFSDVESDQP